MSIHLGKALVKRHPHWRWPSKKHPRFSLSRRPGCFVFLEKGIWRRDSKFFGRFQWPFFCSHTYPVLCWMEVVQMAVLGDIRKLVFHWYIIGDMSTTKHHSRIFTGHPNLLELNPKKQPASKTGRLQIAWQPFITADVFKQDSQLDFFLQSFWPKWIMRTGKVGDHILIIFARKYKQMSKPTGNLHWKAYGKNTYYPMDVSE